MTDWSKLRHAYGNASDVPALIAALVPGPHAEIWHEVFGRICHQGSIYSASYAALPLLADVAERWRPQDRLLILDLAAAIFVPEDSRDCREEWLRPHEPVISRFQSFAASVLILVIGHGQSSFTCSRPSWHSKVNGCGAKSSTASTAESS